VSDGVEKVGYALLESMCAVTADEESRESKGKEHSDVIDAIWAHIRPLFVRCLFCPNRYKSC
jgi:hypothetical protein